MLEVSTVEHNGQKYLKLNLIKLNPQITGAIMSIDGWFKGMEPWTYDLPEEKAEELFEKTKDFMVIWKGSGDEMGGIVKGIDTTNVPDDYIIPYAPKIPLRPHQIAGFNLMVSRDRLILSDQEGVGIASVPIEAKCSHGHIRWGLMLTKASLVYDALSQAQKFTNMTVQ